MLRRFGLWFSRHAFVYPPPGGRYSTSVQYNTQPDQVDPPGWCAIEPVGIFPGYMAKQTSILKVYGIISVSGTVVVVQGLFFGYHYVVFIIPAVVSTFMLYRVFWDPATEMTSRGVGLLGLWALVLVALLGLVTYVDRGTTDVVPFEIIGYNPAALRAPNG